MGEPVEGGTVLTWPHSIPVNTCRVGIRFVDQLHLGDDTDGEYRNSEGFPQIRMSNALGGEYRDMVVCHELVHAWIRINGIHGVLTDETEERIADTLGHELARLLRELKR